MNPISRLRTRARSESGRSATDLPLRMYLPSVGESSKPRIDSSVDLPQPEAPALHRSGVVDRLTLRYECDRTSPAPTCPRESPDRPVAGPRGFPPYRQT